MPCSALIAIGSVPIYLLFFFIFLLNIRIFLQSWISGVCFRDSPSGKKGNTTLTISSISTIHSIFGVNLPLVCLGVA